ncbi:hypothetical protein LTR53_013728, partial [Teratosphaeriaceae sp. CCFEE 6253]
MGSFNTPSQVTQRGRSSQHGRGGQRGRGKSVRRERTRMSNEPCRNEHTAEGCKFGPEWCHFKHTGRKYVHRGEDRGPRPLTRGEAARDDHHGEEAGSQGGGVRLSPVEEGPEEEEEEVGGPGDVE